jgi:hypothetical protein
VKAELERVNCDLAAARAAGGEGGEETMGDPSVEGLGARGKEHDLKRQNARLVLQVKELKANEALLKASQAELKAHLEAGHAAGIDTHLHTDAAGIDTHLHSGRLTHTILRIYRIA